MPSLEETDPHLIMVLSKLFGDYGFAGVINTIKQMEYKGIDTFPIPEVPEEPKTFVEALDKLINKWSVENLNNTPDFIVAQYMLDALNIFTNAITSRDRWYNFHPWKTVELPEPPFKEE